MQPLWCSCMVWCGRRNRSVNANLSIVTCSWIWSEHMNSHADSRINDTIWNKISRLSVKTILITSWLSCLISLVLKMLKPVSVTYSLRLWLFKVDSRNKNRRYKYRLISRLDSFNSCPGDISTSIVRTAGETKRVTYLYVHCRQLQSPAYTPGIDDCLFLIYKGAPLQVILPSAGCVWTEANSKNHHIYIKCFFVCYQTSTIMDSFNCDQEPIGCCGLKFFAIIWVIFIIVAVQDSVYDRQALLRLQDGSASSTPM